MKITFPHMGNAYIAIKALLQNLGLEVVTPPPCSKRTLDIGVRNVPESMCLPLKLNLGNFIEALENGADTILMVGGWGPCRFGYYAQLERDILEDLGYQFDMVILEAPDSRLSDLFQQLRALKTDVSMRQVWSALRLGWEKLKALDEVEKLLHYWLPRGSDPNQTERVYSRALKTIDMSCDRASLKKDMEAICSQFEGLRGNNTGDPLRIGVVGEIYTILEPFANYYMERHLGRLGAEVNRSMFMTQWINDHLLGGMLRVGSCRGVIPLSVPYLNYWVGGHGRETVAYTVKYARDKLDGVIQVGPLTCMPEIVAQSILGKVQEVEGIPVMTLYVDEHSGEAGVITRLEAFLDMIRWQKSAKVVYSHG